MKPKTRRLLYVLAGLAVLGLAAFLVFRALGDNLQFFYSPADIEALEQRPERAIRLGGMVEDGSFEKSGLQVTFVVTDYEASMRVYYDQQQHGLLPTLFREGQGVVAEGRIQPDGSFRATRILAKHDETYMPPEVADSLRQTKEGSSKEGAYQ